MSDLKPHKAGYMKPPKQGQFRRGQSGNPKGRPPRGSDPYTVLRKVLAKRVSVDGGEIKVTIEDALLWLLRQRVLAGERRALNLQQKIFALAAKASPPPGSTQDHALAAKRKLAKLAGIEIDDLQRTGSRE